MLRRQRSRVKGFTLIELMVVVAIIALLISILLPSLSKARAQAFQVKCAGHLSGIFKGIFYYVEDKKAGNGTLPQLGWRTDLGFWPNQILPYVKFRRSKVGSRQGFLRCPAEQNVRYYRITGLDIGQYTDEQTKIMADQGGIVASDDPFASGSAGGEHNAGIGPMIEPVSYHGCCNLLRTQPGIEKLSPPRLDEIDRPYCFPLLTEVPQIGVTNCFRYEWIVDSNAPEYRRHYGGQNKKTNGADWMFADGHVSWHSQHYASTNLICCIDTGAQFEPDGSVVNDLRTAQRRECGEAP